MKSLHFAEVTRNTDPDEGEKLRGAVYFRSETLTGDKEFPEPAAPCFPIAGANGFGFFAVPQVGDIIEIEIDDALEHPEPKWRCMIYSSVDEIAREFRTNYTKRMGFKTKTGHLLIWDDTEGAEEFYLEHTFGSRMKFFANGNISLKGRNVTNRDPDDETQDTESTEFEELLFDFENKVIFLHDHHSNSLTMDENGITINDKNGNTTILDSSGIAINDANGNSVVMSSSGIVTQDSNGNKVTLDSSGAKIEDSNGNVITLSGGGVQIQSSGTVQIDGSSILIAGGGGLAARSGDIAFGPGNLGVPVVSTIITGSSKVLIGG